MFICRYGDRSPKSTLGRVFCILWIITGLVIISIFIAMVTASLAATTHPHFPIHGSLVSVSSPQLTFFYFFSQCLKLRRSITSHTANTDGDNNGIECYSQWTSCKKQMHAVLLLRHKYLADQSYLFFEQCRTVSEMIITISTTFF